MLTVSLNLLPVAIIAVLLKRWLFSHPLFQHNTINKSTSSSTSANTATLIHYVTKHLTPVSVTEEVWLRIEDLFLDWLGSALASRNTHPIPIFEATARHMGPKHGTAQVLANGSTSSPYWAAWMSAASSHTLEQDDVHNGSVMHPAT